MTGSARLRIEGNHLFAAKGEVMTEFEKSSPDGRRARLF